MAVVGDSVLLGAVPAFTAALGGAGFEVHADAAENLSLLGATGQLAAARALAPDVVVTDLGYNDGTDAVEFARRIDAAMAALVGVPKVMWLTQHVFENGRAEMNAQLGAAVARHPSIEVVDWNAVASAQPALLAGDNVHLTPAGADAMAALVLQHLRAYDAALRAPPPSPSPEPGACAERHTGDGTMREPVLRRRLLDLGAVRQRGPCDPARLVPPASRRAGPPSPVRYIGLDMPVPCVSSCSPRSSASTAFW